MAPALTEIPVSWGKPTKKKKRKPAEEYRITNYIIYNKYYKVNKQGADIERET